MWQFAPNSVHYLLSLWQRMVASVPYVKATEPHMLETYTPEVTKAYITSRLDSVALVLRYRCYVFISCEVVVKISPSYNLIISTNNNRNVIVTNVTRDANMSHLFGTL